MSASYKRVFGGEDIFDRLTTQEELLGQVDVEMHNMSPLEEPGMLSERWVADISAAGDLTAPLLGEALEVGLAESLGVGIGIVCNCSEFTCQCRSWIHFYRSARCSKILE